MAKRKKDFRNLFERAVSLVRRAIFCWFAELNMLVPAPIKNNFSKARKEYWLDIVGQDVFVYQFPPDDNGSPHLILSTNFSEIRPMAISSDSVVRVSLDKDKVFIDRFSVPVAAEYHLSKVLVYESERRLPIKAESVIIDHLILDKDDSQNLVCVEWAVVLKEYVKKGEEMAKRLGFTRVEIGLRRGENRKLDYVFHNGNAGQFQLGRRGRALMLAVILFGLSLSCYVFDSINYVEDIKEKVSAIQKDAEDALKLKKRSQRSYESILQLTTIHKAVNPLDILSELTSLLPDDVWIQDFSFKEGMVHLTGYSASASQIVEKLSVGVLIDHPQFEAPITTMPSRDGEEKKERFEISFKIKSSHISGVTK